MKLPALYSRLTPSERRAVREEYVRRQEGHCWYCKSPLSLKSPHEVAQVPVRWNLFPANFLRYPVHLHHDHLTDKTIGAVHAYCNAVSFDYDGD